MASGIRSNLSRRSPLRREGREGRSLVALSAAAAPAAPFDCCTPLLLGHAGRADAAIGTLSREKCYCDCHKTVSRFCSTGRDVHSRGNGPGAASISAPPSQTRQCPARGRALHTPPPYPPPQAREARVGQSPPLQLDKLD